MPESIAEKLSTPAIGRPIDLAWAEYFGEAVRSVLPASTELKLRKQPGIVYVRSEDLVLANLPPLSRINEDQQRAYMHKLLQPLYDEGELDKQTADSGLSLPLQRPDTVILKSKPSYVNVGVALEDSPVTSDPDDEAPDDYTVEAEKEVFEETLNDSRARMPANKSEPRHHIYLGMITGKFERDVLRSIAGELQEPVPILGIDILKLDTRI